MKNTKMKQSIAALAMAAVVAVSLLGYGCGTPSMTQHSQYPQQAYNLGNRLK